MSTTIFLCDDIIVKVLSWLPAKEIARIRCVCKQWLFLTSDPHFIKSHCVRNPHPRISGFFVRDNIYNAKCLSLDANSRPGLPDPSLSFIPVLDNRARISVEASSNGLLICSHVVQRSIAVYEAVYYVCNPTTREFARLHVPREVKRCFSLIFSPSSSPNYKIVSMGSQIHMYSSETREWKLSIDEKSLQELEVGFHYSCRRSVYWNGTVIRMGQRCIVSFDVEKECVKKLAMPSRALSSWRGVYIGESGGKLQMIWRPLRAKQTVFYISEMDSEGSWSPLSYAVDLTPVMDLYPNETQKRPICVSGSKCNFTITSSRLLGLLPVHFFRGGEEGGGEDGVLWLSVPGKIISYSLTNKVFTQVCDLSSPTGTCDCLYDWPNFYSFGHTLFSL